MSLEHLVVVIPGIGGSNLASADGQPVFGHSPGVTVMAPFRPDPLDINRPLLPTGLLRISGVFPWSAVASYS